MFNKSNNPFVSQLKDILNKEPEPIKSEETKNDDAAKVDQSSSSNEQDNNTHGS